MSGAIEVALLDGIAGASGGQVASVRPLTGAHEAMLEPRIDELPAERATRVIAAVTERIGDRAPVPQSLARQLSAGDRERLLLGCAAATLGDQAELVAQCPHEGCGELIELSQSLREAMRPPAGPPRPIEHELLVRDGEGLRKLRFRLPNGADQEAAARQARSDPAAAAAMLLERCLVSTDGDAGAALDDPEIAAALDEAMGELDSAAEASAEGSCPACGGPIKVLLDGMTLLSSGMASNDRLTREIHILASAYHWSETEILALPLARRRRYLDLLQADAGS
ncbi:MAG TPA: hypothetical protein VN231_00165 [Allosphingosinicella sp.]|nr:hypothetical protein [Allosphingosinicella sp.]